MMFESVLVDAMQSATAAVGELESLRMGTLAKEREIEYINEVTDKIQMQVEYLASESTRRCTNIDTEKWFGETLREKKRELKKQIVDVAQLSERKTVEWNTVIQKQQEKVLEFESVYADLSWAAEYKQAHDKVTNLEQMISATKTEITDKEVSIATLRNDLQTAKNADQIWRETCVRFADVMQNVTRLAKELSDVRSKIDSLEIKARQHRASMLAAAEEHYETGGSTDSNGANERETGDGGLDMQVSGMVGVTPTTPQQHGFQRPLQFNQQQQCQKQLQQNCGNITQNQYQQRQQEFEMVRQQQSARSPAFAAAQPLAPSATQRIPLSYVAEEEYEDEELSIVDDTSLELEAINLIPSQPMIRQSMYEQRPVQTKPISSPAKAQPPCNTSPLSSPIGRPGQEAGTTNENRQSINSPATSPFKVPRTPSRRVFPQNTNVEPSSPRIVSPGRNNPSVEVPTGFQYPSPVKPVTPKTPILNRSSPMATGPTERRQPPTPQQQQSPLAQRPTSIMRNSPAVNRSPAAIQNMGHQQHKWGNDFDMQSRTLPDTQQTPDSLATSNLSSQFKMFAAAGTNESGPPADIFNMFGSGTCQSSNKSGADEGDFNMFGFGDDHNGSETGSAMDFSFNFEGTNSGRNSAVDEQPFGMFF